MRDNNILVRHIKPAARKTWDRLGELAGAATIVCDLAEDGGRGCEGRSGIDAAFAGRARRWTSISSLFPSHRRKW